MRGASLRNLLSLLLNAVVLGVFFHPFLKHSVEGHFVVLCEFTQLPDALQRNCPYTESCLCGQLLVWVSKAVATFASCALSLATSVLYFLGRSAPPPFLFFCHI